MLFWIFAAAMTAAVLLLIALPLLRTRAEASGRAAYDLEVYRDQLAELERDVGRGLVSQSQAAAARAEIGRRMLAAAEEAKSSGTVKAAPARGKLAAAFLAVALPVGALAVYLPLGRPELPAQPLAYRDLNKEQEGPSPQQMVAAMDKLKQHLAQNPDDLRGWVLMGQTYARIGRYQEAADAFRKAVPLSQGDASVAAAFGEMLVNANGGVMTDEATRTFADVLAKDPKDPRARFYAALGRFQAGDLQGALDGWRALAAETPADAPWLPTVQERIRETATKLGLDVASVMPQPLPAEAPQAGGGAGQDEMVRGMVESLAAKLQANPDDPNGWMMLSRSYGVLGRHEEALNAARQAVQRAPGRADVHVAVADALLARSPEAAPMPPDAVKALRDALAIEPQHPKALWLLGLDAANTGRKAEAEELWGRLLAQIDPKEPDWAFVRARIDALKGS